MSRCLDFLPAVFVALAWSSLVWPQDCSKAVPIMRSPNDDLAQAQLRATQKCEAERTRRGATHSKSVEALCNESMELLNLPKAKREQQYAACLRGHGYTK